MPGCCGASPPCGQPAPGWKGTCRTFFPRLACFGGACFPETIISSWPRISPEFVGLNLQCGIRYLCVSFKGFVEDVTKYGSMLTLLKTPPKKKIKSCFSMPNGSKALTGLRPASLTCEPTDLFAPWVQWGR